MITSNLDDISFSIIYLLTITTLLDIDVLFIPVGGHFCLDGHSASKLASEIKPKYIVPMSFKTSSEYFYLDGPLKFLTS